MQINMNTVPGLDQKLQEGLKLKSLQTGKNTDLKQYVPDYTIQVHKKHTNLPLTNVGVFV